MIALLPRKFLPVSLVACESDWFAPGGGARAVNDRPYSRPEPDYSGKLRGSCPPFQRHWGDYGEAERAGQEALERGEMIAQLQALMPSG
jgi:hypothetical protein